MPDIFTKAKRSAVMAGMVRSAGNPACEGAAGRAGATCDFEF